MLEDRDYMRQPDFRDRRISFTIALLIVNAIVFIVQMLASNSLRGIEVEENYFALSLAGLKLGYVWQLLTFQFMHAGWLHIIFNSVAIFFFGRPVEMVLGGRRFLILYFSGGIIGGLVQMLFAYLFPTFFGGAVVGASAGASGLVAAFAVFNWTQRFTLFLYFIPLAMRGKTLFWVSIAAVVVGILTPNSGIANAAHLGGILTGFIFARWIFSDDRPQWNFFSRSPRTTKTETDFSTDEFFQNEVDSILEKISAHGIQSLTKRERKVLEKARAKMTKS
jgi:membrane associated rhomboid family serine protease